MVSIRTLAIIFTYAIGLCGMIPLFPWLPDFPRAILVFGLLAGVWQDRQKSWQLKPWMQNVAIVPVFIYYALQFSRANPAQPVISFLAIMLAVRLCGEKSVRHSLQIHAISTFCLASSSLFDLSPVFLIYLALLLFLIPIALVLLTFQNQDGAMTVSRPDLKKILYSGLFMPALALPLLLLFFPIIPRTHVPLWNFLNPPATRTTGYSDTVEPGSQSSISESRTLAFRAEMPRMAQAQLYWRGTVFNRTDGIRWTRMAQIPAEQTVSTDQMVKQIIYPEPTSSRTLIALDRPATIVLPRIKRSPDGVFEIIGTVGQRLSYSANSLTIGTTAQSNPVDSRFYLQLPVKLSGRISSLVSHTIVNAKQDGDKVEFLKNYFRNGGFRYSTKDLATGDKAIEQFLFDKKQGNCEFFASSFALLLRASGVPCRLVGGYLGGEYNEVGGYYLISENNAHVWVEAYIQGNGWVRIDPSSFAVNSADVWTAPRSRSIRHIISLTLDSFNHAWNRSIIAYDFEQQINMAAKVTSRLQNINPSQVLKRSVPYVSGALIVISILCAFRLKLIFRSREQRILKKFLKTVELKYGISTVKDRTGLFEIALASGDSHVSEFVATYAGAVYHDRKLSNEEYLRLKDVLRILKSGKAKSP